MCGSRRVCRKVTTRETRDQRRISTWYQNLRVLSAHQRHVKFMGSAQSLWGVPKFMGSAQCAVTARTGIRTRQPERVIKNGVAAIGRSSRRASQVRRCTFASTAAAPLLPAPAPVPRVLALLLLPPRPPHTRPGTGAHTRVAQHELHSKCQPHPAAVHHKTARARRSCRPDPCAPRTVPCEPQRPTSTASCAMHCTPLTQDLQRQAPHLHRPCPRAAPCPNIAPGRMGCDWPMTDQSAVRCTADMHNAATLLNLVQLSEQHVCGSGSESGPCQKKFAHALRGAPPTRSIAYWARGALSPVDCLLSGSRHDGVLHI